MRARLDALADLDLAPRDDAVDRRAKDGALEIDASLGERGARREHLGVVVDRRVGDQRAVGVAIADRGVAGRRRLGTSGLGGAEAGRGGVVGVARGGQLVTRNRSRGCERLAPLQVDARLFDVRLGRRDLRLGAGLVGRAGGNLRTEPAVRGVEALDLADRRSEIGFGPGDRDLRVGVVEPHEHVAAAHLLRVLDEHRA